MPINYNQYRQSPLSSRISVARLLADSQRAPGPRAISTNPARLAGLGGIPGVDIPGIGATHYYPAGRRDRAGVSTGNAISPALFEQSVRNQAQYIRDAGLNRITYRRSMTGLGGGARTGIGATGIGLGIDPITASAIGAGLSTGIQYAARGIMSLFGGNPRNVAATQVVDSVEPLLAENVTAYAQSPKTQANYQQAVDTFNRGWSYVAQACGDPGLKDSGVRCINERKRGGQFDWFARYLDPITNNPPQSPSATNADVTMVPVTDPSTGETSYQPVANNQLPAGVAANQAGQDMMPAVLILGLLMAGYALSQ